MRISLEEKQQQLLSNTLAKAQDIIDNTDADRKRDWLDNPLTIALSLICEVDIMSLQMSLTSGRIEKDKIDFINAKVDVFQQVKSYLDSGHQWLEELENKDQEADDD